MSDEQNTNHVTVKPTSIGFHCDGECWESFGKEEMLIEILSKNSLSLRDWFVTGGWADIDPVFHAVTEINELHPIQDYLNVEAVKLYSLCQKGAADYEQEWEKFPIVVKISDKMFIFNGTHRIAAGYVSGNSGYFGRFVDLDEIVH